MSQLSALEIPVKKSTKISRMTEYLFKFIFILQNV